jgi:hypothetical protein
MRNTLCLASGVVLLGVLGCSKGSSTGTTSAAIESCFATGGGHMKCVATPGGAQKESRDVDNDGQPDTFVCATHPAAASDQRGDNQNEDNGDVSDGNNEQDDDCAKMGCSDLRKQGDDHGDQQGQSTNDDNDDGKGGGDGDHNHEHQGADDMSCPGSSGGADAGAGAD